MSKAKFAAASTTSSQSGSSSASFASGFLLGQLTLALILFFFIKFFLFGDAVPTSESRAAARTEARRQRALSHTQSLRKKRSSVNLGARHGTSSNSQPVLTTEKILDKTYYNVDNHQPESLDWFNVLIAQTIAQLRADALDDDAILSSLTAVLNGSQKPDFLDEIRVTEISLGEEFPIFSNCRIIPVDEDGAVIKPTRVPPRRPGTGSGRGMNDYLRDSRLQARMDVDLSDVVTLGIETKLVLNYPKPFVAVLPVALSVSVTRFSGTLSVSFTPSQSPTPPTDASNTRPPFSRHSTADPTTTHPTNSPPPPQQPTPHSPTTLTFTFLSDYRLDLAVHSLIGSRSRLQDVPKIAQLVEQRLHAWFDERCVEPRFQQVVLPSLWPRKRNVRGGDADAAGGSDGQDVDDSAGLDRDGPLGRGGGVVGTGRTGERGREKSVDGLMDGVDEADLLGRDRDDDDDETSAQGTARESVNGGTRYRTHKSGGSVVEDGDDRRTGSAQDTLEAAGAALRAAEARSKAREQRHR